MAKSCYIVQWDEQPMHLSKVLSSLVETQTLVDLTVNCNSYTIKVHKCILAANSVYFRDHLQKDMSIDRVVVNGVRHVVLKALIEFMYCGETSIPEEYIHELVIAAKFFGIRGVTSIIPQKLGGEFNETAMEFSLINKPPIFFSKNDKAKYYVKEKESAYHSMFDNSNRRKPQSKVTAEAHVALAKEEAASRFALEMLKKDINNTSNVFVIDETCTEATVETNLTAQYENTNNMMQIQEYVIENDLKTDNKPIIDDEPANIDITLLPTKQSPTQNNDFSGVLYKTGGFVNMNNQLLENISASHAISYHVVPDSTVDFQQYICNNFGQYSVELHPNQSNLVENCYDINSKEKKHLTFTELVADTVTSDYETSGINYEENSGLETSTFDNILSNDSTKLEEEIFVENYVQTPAESFEDTSKETIVENVALKKKRGRPPKRKIVEKNQQENLDEKFIENDKENINPLSFISETDETKLYLANQDNRDQTFDDLKSNLPLATFEQNVENNLFLNDNRRQTRSATKFNI